MYNPEHHLHNMEIVKSAMKRIIKSHLVQFGFNADNFLISLKSNDYETITIVFSDLEVAFNISKREAYSIAFRKTYWPKGSRRYIESFKGLLKDTFDKVKEFAKPFYTVADQLDKYSEEWYYNYMKYDLEFLIKFFPQVLENNDLTMFEKDILNEQ